MIKKIIFLLLFYVIKIESSIEFKNETQNIKNLYATVYEKKLCGKGKEMPIDEDLPVDKKYLVEFNINGKHFEYTTKVNFNYVFSIKDDGIYLEDCWQNYLSSEDEFISSSGPIQLFAYNY